MDSLGGNALLNSVLHLCTDWQVLMERQLAEHTIFSKDKAMCIKE